MSRLANRRMRGSDWCESDAGGGGMPPRSPVAGRLTVFVNEKPAVDFFINLASLRSRQELCDVQLEARMGFDEFGTEVDVVQLPTTVRIHAHRVVLAAASPYFRAMFTTGMKESADKIVFMKNVDGDVLSLLVDYMYTGRLPIDETTVQATLSTANLLQLNCVRDACSRFLLEQLDVSNCLGIAAFARLHACTQLSNAAQLFTRQHFGDLVDSEELLYLDEPSFLQLIGDDRITTKGEEAVFEAVINWVRHDLPNRESCLPNILSSVRLPLLPRKYLLNRVYYEPLMRSNRACKDMLLSVCKYLLERDVSDVANPPSTSSTAVATTSGVAAATRRASLASSDVDVSEMLEQCPQWLRPRQPVPLSQYLMIVGGQAPKAIANVDLFDPDSHLWTPCAQLPQRRCRSGVSLYRDWVYASGGFNGAQRVRSVDVYDPRRDMWISGAPMEARRSTHGTTVLDGVLFAVGGFDGSSGLCSGEMLDHRIGTWTPLPSMSVRRSSVGVAALENCIYAIGGFDGASKQCLNSVEVFDTRANRWRPGPTLRNVRSGAGVTVWHNRIVAVGGHRGADIHQSVEVLCNDVWHELPGMTVGRRNAAVVAVHEHLFAVGGDDGASNLSTIESIQLPANLVARIDDGGVQVAAEWFLLQAQMPQGRSYAGIALLPKDHC